MYSVTMRYNDFFNMLAIIINSKPGDLMTVMIDNDNDIERYENKIPIFIK